MKQHTVANKLFYIFTLLFIICNCIYFFYDFNKKQNNSIVKKIEFKSKKLLLSKYVKSSSKADFITIEEKLHPSIYNELLAEIKPDSLRLEIIHYMIVSCFKYQVNKSDLEENDPLLGNLFLTQIEVLNNAKPFLNNLNLIKNIDNIAYISLQYSMIKRLNYTLNIDKIDESFKSLSENSYSAAMKLLGDTIALKIINIRNFNKLIRVLPILCNYDSSKIKLLTAKIDPFNYKTFKIFNTIYQIENNTKQTLSGNLMQINGYYQLANLFSYCSDFESLNKCFDSVNKYHHIFLDSNNELYYSNFIFGLFKCNKLTTNKGIAFVEKMSTSFSNKDPFSLLILFQEQLIERGQDVNTSQINNTSNAKNEYILYDNKADGEKLSSLINYNITNALHNKKYSTDERNYIVALLYKSKAYYRNNLLETFDTLNANKDLNSSFSYYNNVSAKYLEQSIDIGSDTYLRSVCRSDLFKYPDHISLSNVRFPYYYNLQKERFPGILIDYISKNYKIKTFYDNEALLNNFLLNYAHVILNRIDQHSKNIPGIYPFTEALSIKNNNIDTNFMFAFLSVFYSHFNQQSYAKEYIKSVNLKKLFNEDNITDDYNGQIYISLANKLCVFIATSLNDTQTIVNEKILNEPIPDVNAMFYKLIDVLPEKSLISNALLVTIDSLQNRGKYDIAIRLMDTILNGNIATSPIYGEYVFKILGKFGSEHNNRIATLLIKYIDDIAKPACLKSFVKGIAETNNYYEAYSKIPSYVSPDDQLLLYLEILKNEIDKKNNNWNKTFSFDDNFQ